MPCRCWSVGLPLVGEEEKEEEWWWWFSAGEACGASSSSSSSVVLSTTLFRLVDVPEVDARDAYMELKKTEKRWWKSVGS